MLQEFIARAAGVGVGTYRQISDSFHIYTDSDVWKRVRAEPSHHSDPYRDGTAWPFPLMDDRTGYEDWLVQLNLLLKGELAAYDGRVDPFFRNVAAPLLRAWEIWKDAAGEPDKINRVDWAMDYVSKCVTHCDWKVACSTWLERRRNV
jgi:hypothetical protein